MKELVGMDVGALTEYIEQQSDRHQNQPGSRQLQKFGLFNLAIIGFLH